MLQQCNYALSYDHVFLCDRLNPEDLFSTSRELAKTSNLPPNPSSGTHFFDYNEQAAESTKNQIGVSEKLPKCYLIVTL